MTCLGCMVLAFVLELPLVCMATCEQEASIIYGKQEYWKMQERVRFEFAQCLRENNCTQEIQTTQPLHLQITRSRLESESRTSHLAQAIADLDTFCHRLDLATAFCGSAPQVRAQVRYSDHRTEAIDGVFPFCIPTSCQHVNDRRELDSFLNHWKTSHEDRHVLSLNLNGVCEDESHIHINIANAPDDSRTRENSKNTTIGEALGGGGAVILGLVLLILFRKRRRHQESVARSSDANDVTSPENLTYHEVVSPAVAEASKASKSKTQTQESGTSSDNLEVSTQMLDATKLKIGSIIGQGTFGCVYCGEYFGLAVAVKVLFHQQAATTNAFEREVAILRTLHHPHIVQFIGATCVPEYGLCAVTEFLANADLTCVLQQTEQHTLNFTWTQSRPSKTSILRNTIMGLSYLHGFQPPVLHRDLKSRNILLSEHYVAKIADFGVSRTLSTTATMTAAGSVMWQSPEVLRGEQFDERSDIYSIGIIMVELDTEALPYANTTSTSEIHLNSHAIAYRVVHDDFRPSFTSTCPERVLSLGTRCMATDPQERPSALAILQELKTWRFPEIRDEEDTASLSFLL